MAVNALNNKIGFPGFSPTQASPAVPIPTPVQADKTVKEPPKSVEDKPSENKPQTGMSDKTKYMLGAGAIAASVIAGICIYRNGKSAEKAVENASNVLENGKAKIQKAFEDTFLKKLEKEIPEFDIENNLVTTFEKGAKRIDKVEQIAGINQTLFQRKDGSEFAKVNWTDDGKVFSYVMKDKSGRVIRDYNFSKPNYVTKTRYNKENELISKFQSNLDGWEQLQTFDKGNMVSEVTKRDGIVT